MSLPVDEKTMTVLRGAIDAEEKERRHLVIALSGAHAYGFPSPDSDLDLKAIHVERTDKLLGLGNVVLHADRMEVIDGVEIDYTSNEIKPVLLGVLHGNGNYIERILGPLLPFQAPELADLKPLVHKALSRRIANHYLGFATSQREAFLKEPIAKKLLYVLRTALTGQHALATGEIETDLGALCEPYGFAAAKDLIATKRRGERVTLDEKDRAHYLSEAERALSSLRAAVETSVLPPEPNEEAARALERWLLDLRRAS